MSSKSSKIGKEDSKSRLILEGNLYRVIIKLAIPIMIANLIQTIYNLTDTYFVSMIGDVEVGAVGFTWPIIFCLLGLGGGLASGAVSLISQSIGAGNEENAKKVAGQSFVFSLIIGTILGIVGYIIAPDLIALMGATGKVYSVGVAYTRIIFISLPFTFVFLAFQGILQAQGNMVVPMVLSAISIAINIIFDPLFIFVFDMGVQGAAYATVLAKVVLGIICAVYYFTSKKLSYRAESRHFVPDLKTIAEISRIGIPNGLGQSTTAIGFIILNGFVLSYGESVLTAFVIGNRIVSLIVMPCMGIGSAVSAIAGQNLGANNIKRTKQVLTKSIVLSMSFAFMGIILLLLFSQNFIRVFTSTAQIAGYAMDYARIITIALPLMGLYSIWVGYFVGVGRGNYSMFVMIARLMIFRIPSVMIMKYILEMNEYAIWYPIVISNLLAVILGYLLYRRIDWTKRAITI